MYLSNHFGYFNTKGKYHKAVKAGSYTLQMDFTKPRKTGQPYRHFREAIESGVFFGPEGGTGYAMWVAAGLVVRPQWYAEMFTNTSSVEVHGMAGACGEVVEAMTPLFNMTKINVVHRAPLLLRRGVSDDRLRPERIATRYMQGGTEDREAFRCGMVNKHFPSNQAKDPVHHLSTVSFETNAGMAKVMRDATQQFWPSIMVANYMEAIATPITFTFYSPESRWSPVARQVIIGG